MINTELTIERMPSKLKAFKKYIEKYACSYSARYVEELGVDMHALTFYHKQTMMPYVMVWQAADSNHAEIYVNYQADNWNSDTIKIRRENFISNDMKAFLAVIRECETEDDKVMHKYAKELEKVPVNVITNIKALEEFENKPKEKVELVEPILPEYKR
jgi:hypothetical protein